MPKRKVGINREIFIRISRVDEIDHFWPANWCTPRKMTTIHQKKKRKKHFEKLFGRSTKREKKNVHGIA